MGCYDGKISKFRLLLAKETFQDVAHDGAAGKPQRKAEANPLGEGEQFHLLAQLAVIPLLCLFHHHQVLLKHGFLGEGDAVDTGELLTLLVSAPVCSGYRSELHGLDCLGAAKMRAAAKVGEVAVLVICDGAVLKLVYEFHLVLVAFCGEVLQGVSLAYVNSLVLFLAGCEFQHLLLDLGKVGICDLLAAEVHVVIKSVLDGRADTKLDSGVQGLQSLCHKMGRGVPENPLGVVAVPLEQRYRSVLVDRAVQIVHNPVHLGGQNFGCKAGADALSNFVSGYSFYKWLYRSVWKCYVDHIVKYKECKYTVFSLSLYLQTH